MSEGERGIRAHPGFRREWRGDFFSSELPAVRDRLAAFPVIEREFATTITVFLSPVSHGVVFDNGIRLRAYADLHEPSPDRIRSLLASGLCGKLQMKHAGGRVDAHGDVRLPAFGGSGPPTVALAGTLYAPRSIRTGSRRHFGLRADGIPAQPGELSESHRVTLDTERRLFRVHADGGVAYLGAMGPRLEVKTPAPRAVAAALAALNFDGMMKTIPWRGIELMMQDILRDLIDRSSLVANREIELKLDVHGEIPPDALRNAITARCGAGLLLPYPHVIMRMRRYHVCISQADRGHDHTIVETPGGLLSQKRKRGAHRHGMAFVRETAACFTTDRDGRACSVDEFAAHRGLSRVNSFTKLQTKIPFALANGHAYLASLDHCVDTAGRSLRQLELEYIGNRVGGPTPTTTVACELEGLAAVLRDAGLGPRLTPSGCSKHAFFGGSSVERVLT